MSTNRNAEYRPSKKDKNGLSSYGEHIECALDIDLNIETLIELVPDMMLVVNQSGKILLANTQAQVLLGYEKNELLNLAIENLIPACYREPHLSHRRDYLANPSIKHMGGREGGLKFVRKDGIEVACDIKLSPLEIGWETLVMCSIRDVTALTAVQTNLQSTLNEMELLKKRIENLCDNAPIGLCFLDTELRFVHINEYLARMNGLSVADHIGRKVTEILPDVNGIEEKLLKVIETGQSTVEENVEGKAPDDTRTTRVVSYFPDKNIRGDVKGIRCIVKDVSDVSQLAFENALLKDEIKLNHKHESVLGQSVVTKQLLKLVEQVASTEASVLIEGETGTGKELIAREVHRLSACAGHTMVTVNCAALPASLIESELFGREKGAFTGALAKQMGRFEAADNSTIFLDEIGELPLELQPKLLRVLQEGEFERLGGTQTIKVNVRVVAATNQNLQNLVQKGLFRQDLYYRLSSFPIPIQPLRERREDIPELVWAFVHKYVGKLGKRIDRIPDVTMQSLIDYPWPGNVRELRNVIERAMILTNSKTLNVELPNIIGHDEGINAQTLSDVERNHILKVLNDTDWRVRGENGAAEILGLKPSTLESKMTKLNIKRSEKGYGA